MSTTAYLAFDLGAESGRTMLATLHDGRASLEEINRFPNLPQRLPSGLHWNLLELWRNLQEGLRLGIEAAEGRGLTISSVGVDTWGVDFGLVSRHGELLGLPYAYRDARNLPAMQKAVEQVSEKDLYDSTGTQIMPFNTLFQLKAQRTTRPDALESAAHLLTMPDLLHYFFSGVPANEATNASTTQMVDARTGEWNRDLMDRLNHLPHHFLGKIVPAGTRIGEVREEVMHELGLDDREPISVIAPGTHDTASAVAAVPVTDTTKPWAYISSGTWSLMGAELDEPIITDEAREAGFTNERGVANKIRFLKNISGLWLVQQTRADFAKRGEVFDYTRLTELAAKAAPFVTLINTEHAPFASPGDMCQKIDEYAKATGQPQPGEGGKGRGPYIRTCLESLALTYADTLENMENLLGYKIETLHIVGGGGQNRLLNQMTADAINRRVVVGPFEATALGNALTQAIGNGHVADLAELRKVVAASINTFVYEPQDPGPWQEQLARLRALPADPSQ